MNDWRLCCGKFSYGKTDLELLNNPLVSELLRKKAIPISHHFSSLNCQIARVGKCTEIYLHASLRIYPSWTPKTKCPNLFSLLTWIIWSKLTVCKEFLKADRKKELTWICEWSLCWKTGRGTRCPGRRRGCTRGHTASHPALNINPSIKPWWSINQPAGEAVHVGAPLQAPPQI
jgi:hypothetical protein